MFILLGFISSAVFGAGCLAILDIAGLYLFCGINIGEDFNRTGSGYVDYVRYGDRLRNSSLLGAAIGAVIFGLCLL